MQNNKKHIGKNIITDLKIQKNKEKNVTNRLIQKETKATYIVGFKA